MKLTPGQQLLQAIENPLPSSAGYLVFCGIVAFGCFALGFQSDFIGAIAISIAIPVVLISSCLLVLTARYGIDFDKNFLCQQRWEDRLYRVKELFAQGDIHAIDRSNDAFNNSTYSGKVHSVKNFYTNTKGLIPKHIATNLDPPSFVLGTVEFTFLPEFFLAEIDGAVSRFDYMAACRPGDTVLVHTPTASSGQEIVGEKWQYTTLKGEKDLRFSSNKIIYKVYSPTSIIRLGNKIEFDVLDDQNQSQFICAAFSPRGDLKSGTGRTNGLREMGMAGLGILKYTVSAIAIGLLAFSYFSDLWVIGLFLMFMYSSIMSGFKRSELGLGFLTLSLILVFVASSFYGDFTNSGLKDFYIYKPTARCSDGTLSYSANNSGTCSWHGGVSEWNPIIPPKPVPWLLGN
jgi:hypothetical protein